MCPYNLKTKERKAYIEKCVNYIVCWIREFKCQRCGLEEKLRSLHFHHIDPKTKRFAVTGKAASFKETLVESLFCNYLCEPCHYDEHITLGDYSGYFDFIDRLGCAYVQDLLGLPEGT